MTASLPCQRSGQGAKVRQLEIWLIGCCLMSGCADNDTNQYANVDMNAQALAPRPDVTASGSGKETAAQRRARLREKAKADPEGADAEAIQNMSRNEVLASAINSAGYLCARVTSAVPVGGNIKVSCVEYRSGAGRVVYDIDPNAGTVTPL